MENMLAKHQNYRLIFVSIFLLLEKASQDKKGKPKEKKDTT